MLTKRNSIQDSLMRLVERLSRAAVVPASIFMLAMMMLIVVRVAVRLWGISIAGTYEIIELMAILVSTCTIIYAAAEGSTIIIDILISRFSPRARNICMRLTSIVGILFWGTVGWASIWYIGGIGAGKVTQDLEIPHMPFKIVWIIGMFIYCLIILRELFQTIRSGNSK